MSEIRKYITLIESFERMDEVKVIGNDNHSPLKDTDSVLLYHGTSSVELVSSWIKHGFTGDTKANRAYSYEFNNNPKGLFVTPDLSTAKQFGTVIIEFHASVKDLESPVWPNGTFTGQGQMSGRFDSDDEREQERLRVRDKMSSSEEEYIKDSDRPELAAILMGGGERQALFTGDVNPNAIRAIWIKNEPDKAKSTYTRMKPKEFVNKFENGEFNNFRFKKYNMDDHDTDKAVTPREYLSGEEFIQRIIDSYPERIRSKLTHEKVAAIFIKEPNAIKPEVWSDRQFNHYKNEIGKMK